MIRRRKNAKNVFRETCRLCACIRGHAHSFDPCACFGRAAGLFLTAVGIGTHDELLGTCEVYREIHEAQYKKEDASK